MALYLLMLLAVPMAFMGYVLVKAYRDEDYIAQRTER